MYTHRYICICDRTISHRQYIETTISWETQEGTNDRSRSLLTGVTACDNSWPLHKVQTTDRGHCSLEWQPVTEAGHYTRYKWQIAVTIHWSDSLWQQLAITQGTNDRSRSLLTGVTACDRSWPLHNMWGSHLTSTRLSVIRVGGGSTDRSKHLQ